jgi:ankyrin repeat protein
MVFQPREETEYSLHLAAWTGNNELLRTHLTNWDQDKSSADPSGYTALHLAIWNMHGAVVERLLDTTTDWVSAQTYGSK